MRLKDRVAIVTGAARGIGRGIALKFAQEGARVVANDLSLMAAESVSKKIEQMMGKNKALPIEADVSSMRNVEVLFNETVAEFGRVDALVSARTHCSRVRPGGVRLSTGRRNRLGETGR